MFLSNTDPLIVDRKNLLPDGEILSIGIDTAILDDDTLSYSKIIYKINDKEYITTRNYLKDFGTIHMHERLMKYLPIEDWDYKTALIYERAKPYWELGRKEFWEVFPKGINQIKTNNEFYNWIDAVSIVEFFIKYQKDHKHGRRQ